MKNKLSIINYQLSIIILCLLFSSCHGGHAEHDEEEEVETVTPVTVTHCTISDMQETVELNAVSHFLQKNQTKATTKGYIKSADIIPGQHVSKGQTLFVLKSKEAENLGTIINELGPGANFIGEIKIVANISGFVHEVNFQTGDYVMEGDVLTEITDSESLVFLLQLPYELNPHLAKNKTLTLELPDGKSITGTLSMSMPTVDPVSQTQSIVIQIPNDGSIPENLIAKVKIIKSIKENAVSLPKAAILSDETQEHFWIMKMIDEETAVKVPIVKGIELNGQVEIISPELSPDDVILETGNYGLSDVAKVEIIEEEDE